MKKYLLDAIPGTLLVLMLVLEAITFMIIPDSETTVKEYLAEAWIATTGIGTAICVFIDAEKD